MSLYAFCVYLLLAFFFSRPVPADRLIKSKRFSTRVDWLLVLAILVNSTASVAQSGGASAVFSSAAM